MEQHQQALKHANEVRTARAAVLHDLRGGRTSLAAALDHTATATMMVVELLRQMPWRADNIGRVHRPGASRGRAHHGPRRMLLVTGIPEHRRIGDLTDRQRGVLLAAAAARFPNAYQAVA